MAATLARWRPPGANADRRNAGQAGFWSPDGERLAYRAGFITNNVLTIAGADGTGAVSTVECPGERCDPTDWSPDGRWLLVTVHAERDQDVWMLPVEGNGSTRPLLVQPFPEHDARFSPDGRLVAYVSDETGRPEVSVQTIDSPRRREVISVVRCALLTDDVRRRFTGASDRILTQSRCPVRKMSRPPALAPTKSAR